MRRGQIWVPTDLDTSVAHPARVYDYWLGGTTNFAADREAGDRVLALLLGVLHLIQDQEDPWAIVARIMAAVPTGSYLALSHPALDIGPQQREAQKRYNERVSTPQTLRERPDVARFFTDLELIAPGLVQVHQWRPDADDAVPADFASAHGGVAWKR
ncbi:MAG: SAM-dependent methyltransferase [Micromonosporaceae bacterium]